MTALQVGASAASPCAQPGPANARTTTSVDGTRVSGSACADRIVVTSPLVREVIGGEGDDVIFANPNVEIVDAGAGDDAIYGELPVIETGVIPPQDAGVQYQPVPEGSAQRAGFATASITQKECKAGVSCYGGDGSQELIGSSGNDRIFGQRGNDILKGNAGNDELFGGVGDESLISGGAGNDLLSGGLGTDTVNGNQESDLTRGDGTIDSIEDTGASGTDTLSFASGVTPGFHGSVSASGFPADADSEERGVRLYLDGSSCEGHQACNNDARYGGGLDSIAVGGFENVIGTPFSDDIVGSSGANRIDGGGGADVIDGMGGDDEIYGGPDGDFIRGGEGSDTVFGQGGTNNCAGDVETPNQCSGSSESVVQRDRSKISVGFMATSVPAALSWVQLFLTGSIGTDRVNAAYSLEGGTGYVTFTTEGESASFDTSGDAASTNCAYEATKVKCTLPKPLDSITLAGMDGNDRLALSGFPETTTPVMLGGEGDDEVLGGGSSEDMLVDGNGNGNDVLKAFGYDDALINNEGQDNLQGGNGNDLLLSAVNCEGDVLQGAESGSGDGAAVNSTSWAKLPVSVGGTGVVADLEAGTAGNKGGPGCTSGETGQLLNIDDLEGSTGVDKLYGDPADNNLLGRLSGDELFGRAGNDNLESAEDKEFDNVGGGSGTADSCRYDLGIDTVNGCEKKTGV
ncbi:MAG TPA: hypothetical protein VIS95_03210 [Solirubrobacterales bacterium]